MMCQLRLTAWLVPCLLWSACAECIAEPPAGPDEQRVAQLAALYASDFRLHPLSINSGFLLLGFAALLGWLGAYLSVSFYLRKIEPR